MKESLYLTRVRLKNVRCFDDVDISFTSGAHPRMWTVLIGDNGAGKSTLLRAIAIGLCNESSANALLAELPGSFIRQNKRRRPGTKAEIILDFSHKNSTASVYTVTTHINKDETHQEVARKEITLGNGFSWDKIFVCGYGVNRSTKGEIVSRETGSSRDNLLTLFRDRSNLFDPEQVLRDLEYQALKENSSGESAFEACKKHLLKILRLKPNHKILVSPTSVEVLGPWGQIPLSALGDGYRGTMTWILDLLAVAVKTDRSIQGSNLSGIVLLDEVDEHLHPKWQKEIIPVLSQRFPHVQFWRQRTHR
jgi:energy-coupling factor transporter ATP-binding protein EcfA2